MKAVLHTLLLSLQQLSIVMIFYSDFKSISYTISATAQDDCPLIKISKITDIPL